MNRVLLSVLFIISIQMNAQYATDTVAKKLNIKKILKKVYHNNDKTPSMTYTEFYDNNGKRTKRTSYNNRLSSISIQEYFFYNNKGQLIKEKSVHYNQNDSTISIQNYSYNLKGELDSNAFGRITYKYNKKGELIESIHKTAKPHCNIKNLYIYNSLGLLKKEIAYYCNSKEREDVLDYNDHSTLVKRTITHYSNDSEGIKPGSKYEHSYIYKENGLLETEYQKEIIAYSHNRSDNRTYTYEYLSY